MSFPRTSTQSSVGQSATSVNLLPENTSRLGVTIHNDSTSNLFIILGSVASLTSFTVRLVPNAYYELPFVYTGNIDGIWAAGGTGAARITEFTP